MKIVIFFACAVFYFVISAVDAVRLRNCECGVPNDGISTRIVGGEESIPHVFPWIALILNKGQLHCGGSLINDRYILTAGHCIRWSKEEDLEVYLGMHDQEARDGVLIGIEKAILHDDFTSDYLHDTNDIALIKLKTPIRFIEEISPVCLPHPASEYTGRSGIVAGWGRMGNKLSPSRFLNQAEVKIMSYATCRNSTLGKHIAHTMMCAYSPNHDACQGDSGGPLVYERRPSKIEQIGVVSWGIGCATPGIPGVYTKVPDYLDWIAYHTQDAVYCAYN